MHACLLPACPCVQDRADAVLLQQDPTGTFLLQPRLPWLVSRCSCTVLRQLALLNVVMPAASVFAAFSIG
jgi:hypothetical protein